MLVLDETRFIYFVTCSGNLPTILSTEDKPPTKVCNTHVGSRLYMNYGFLSILPSIHHPIQGILITTRLSAS